MHRRLDLPAGAVGSRREGLQGGHLSGILQVEWKCTRGDRKKSLPGKNSGLDIERAEEIVSPRYCSGSG